MSVKIVHAADFHLDSAFGALSAEQARQRRRESRELLTRLCNYVNQNGVDLVLPTDVVFNPVFPNSDEEISPEVVSADSIPDD